MGHSQRTTTLARSIFRCRGDDAPARTCPLLLEELRADEDYQFAQGGNAPTAHQFQPCALHFTPEMTLPAVNGDAPLYRSLVLSEEDGERYDALVEAVSPKRSGTMDTASTLGIRPPSFMSRSTAC